MRQALDDGKIVIAAGFQGIDEDFNITTLGRGGSDTTAVALAAVLAADACEIYTDVDGVYTTDPRVLPEARRVSRISYDEMLELASLGAGVMHNRSIEFAKKFSVPIHVRTSFSDVPGTMIVAEPESPDQPVGGAALAKNEARVTILGVPDRPGTSLAIFSEIAAQRDLGRHDRAERRRRRHGRHLVHRARGRSAAPRSKRPRKSPPSWGPKASATTTTWPRFRSSGWAWPGRPASPSECSAPWPSQASTSR